MKKQVYQPPELRDASNNIIQAGTYGRTSPLVNADNTGVLDYINNNLEALYDMINAHKTYVASKADLPAAGDAGTIYVASDTGVWYGWDGVKKVYVAYSDPRTAADEAKASASTAATNASTATTQATASAASATAAASTEEKVEAMYKAMLFDIIGPPPSEMDHARFIVGAGPAAM